MANWVAVVDADVDRRESFLRRARKNIAPVAGLETGECRAGDFVALWASNPGAPVSQISTEDSAAVLWGHALDHKTGAPASANALALARSQPEGLPHAHGGFHAAVTWDRVRGLTANADILGLFPVYHWNDPHTLLVGSSAAPFREHRRFRAQLDPDGLVGILMTGGPVAGKTLLRGVARLCAGNLLEWSPSRGVRELRHFEIPVSERYADLPYAAQLAILYDALEGATTRALGGRTEAGMLLSGGRDSRLLAGMMHARGVRTTALTLGTSREYEAMCAARVADTLGFEHRVMDVGVERYPEYAERQAHWEHLCGGMSTLYTWKTHELARGMGASIATAHLLDLPVGGAHASWPYDPASRTMHFERFFATANSKGISRNVLERLLRADVFRGTVSECADRVREEYVRGGERESHRSYRFFFRHWARFHAGSVPWRVSFGAWPLLPVLDPALLEECGGLAAPTVSDRRAQEDLIRARFPHLAVLPLDRNSDNTRPLTSSLRHLARESARSRLGRIGALVSRARWHERRYYYRVYDFDGPGWQAIRRCAEPRRSALDHLFDPAVLEELLPPPHVQTAWTDPIVQSNGPKLLLGLLLWSERWLG